MRVDGQVALVTGAGRGIGRGCALALAEAGAEVIVMSRTASEISEVVRDIKARGGCASAIACDVTDQEAVTATFEGIEHLDADVLGVQWHPEMLAELEPIFGWLVGVALK